MTIQQKKNLMDPINTTEYSLKKNTKAVMLGLISKPRFFRDIFITSLRKGFCSIKIVW